MQKIEIITEIMNLYERNKELEFMIKKLDDPSNIVENKKVLSETELKILSFGKEKMLKDFTYSWSRVSLNKNADGELTCTKYVDWLSNKINGVPNNFSKEEFIKQFEKELVEMYENEKEEEIANNK